MEPTYEGLKPLICTRTMFLPPRLEPTYEGLKLHSQLTRTLNEIAGLEPTYEGLKQAVLYKSSRE